MFYSTVFPGPAIISESVNGSIDDSADGFNVPGTCFGSTGLAVKVVVGTTDWSVGVVVITTGIEICLCPDIGSVGASIGTMSSFEPFSSFESGSIGASNVIEFY